jgi:hypothetical protein
LEGSLLRVPLQNGESKIKGGAMVRGIWKDVRNISYFGRQYVFVESD